MKDADQRPSILRRIANRLRWYVRRFQMDNWAVGRAVELLGNTVRLGGLRFSVDNPLVQTRHKSTIYFGIYELGERALVERFVEPGSAVLELGGSIGVVSCLINRRLQDPARHLVVEANPSLIPTLENNRRLNGCKFQVENLAVAYGSPTIAFTRTGHFLTGSLMEKGADQVEVRTTSLAPLIERLGTPPVVLVCDIEGAEVFIFEHELAAIRRSVSMIIMETHPGVVGQDRNGAMLHSLACAGFRKVDEVGDVVALANDGLPSPKGPVPAQIIRA